MSKKINKLIIELKTKAYKLRAKYMLPFGLVYEISQIDENSPIDWVDYLKEQSIHMLRVEGYYSTYKTIEEDFNRIIKNQKERRFA